VIALLKQLDHQLQRLEAGFAEVVTAIRSRSWLLGRTITAIVNHREISGTAVDVNADGHLILRSDSGETAVLSSAEQVRRV
jgi:biotin-(acetyl-CoA carboxylase) ligase